MLCYFSADTVTPLHSCAYSMQTCEFIEAAAGDYFQNKEYVSSASTCTMDMELPMISTSTNDMELLVMFK